MWTILTYALVTGSILPVYVIQGDAVVPAVNLSIALPPQIVLHEPVVARLIIRNTGDQPLALNLGTNYKSGLRFWIRPIPDGAVVPITYASWHEMGDPGDVRLQPNEQWERELLLNDWFAFDTPGHYEVTVGIDVPIRTSGRHPVKAGTASGRVLVRERDATALRKLCECLAATASTEGTTERGFESVRRLAAVHDEACIPPIAQLLSATQAYDSLLITALEKTATDGAVSLLQTLLAQGGERAELAADALSRVRVR